MYAYGGFEISSTPGYTYPIGNSPNMTAWLEAGGSLVVANIRGGGEFGPEWHQPALKDKRQVAFDDMIAVAEDLIDIGLTSPRRLGAMGRSNGGLLMGEYAGPSSNPFANCQNIISKSKFGCSLEDVL